MGKRDKAAIEAAYALAKSRLAQARSEAIHDGLQSLASVQQDNGRALAGREAARAVIEAVVRECDATIDRLIQAHVQAGDRDAEAIAGRIGTDFLGNELSRHPGAALLEGRGMHAPAAIRTIAEQTVHIKSALGRLSAEAKHRAAIAVASAPNRLQRFTAWAHDNRIIVGGIVAVGVLLALLGVAKSIKDLYGGCAKDADCKGERVCQGGTCVEPTAGAWAPASIPSTSAPVQTASVRPAPMPSAAGAGSALPANSAR